MVKRERDLRVLCRHHGWHLERARRHWVLLGPRGERVIAARTPGDAGNLRVLEGAIRRAGRAPGQFVRIGQPAGRAPASTE